mmetsp:Transcript_5100/g.16340  ORF Transcript_5100/g.16340 Transcript_5100/m.16340 type:complete len:284 (+) Transcript_5100:98-949(+)
MTAQPPPFLYALMSLRPSNHGTLRERSGSHTFGSEACTASRPFRKPSQSSCGLGRSSACSQPQPVNSASLQSRCSSCGPLRLWAEDELHQARHLGDGELLLVEHIEHLRVAAPLAEPVQRRRVGQPAVILANLGRLAHQVVQHVHVELEVLVDGVPVPHHLLRVGAQPHHHPARERLQRPHRHLNVAVRRRAVRRYHDDDALPVGAEHVRLGLDASRRLPNLLAQRRAAGGSAFDQLLDGVDLRHRVAAHADAQHLRRAAAGRVKQPQLGRRAQVGRQRGVPD